MDINRLLKFYEKKLGTEFDKDDPFLIKYDKNKNSVFDKNEMEILANDLRKFSNIDFDENNISSCEYVQLYNSIVDKEHREYDATKLGENLEIAVSMSEIEDYEKNFRKQGVQNNIGTNTFKFTKEEKTKVQKYINNPKYKTYFSNITLKSLAKLDEKKMSQFDTLFEELSEKNFINYDNAINIVKIFDEVEDEKELNYATNLLKKGVDGFYVTSILKQKENRRELLDTIIEKLSVDEKNFNSNSEGIAKLIDGSDEKFDRVTKFIERKNNLLTLDNILKINQLCEIETKDFDRVFELIETKSFDKIDADRISSIADLDEPEFQKAKEIFINPDYDKFPIKPLINLDENRRLKIKSIVEKDGTSRNIRYLDKLCKLKDKEISEIEKLQKVDLRGEPMNLGFALELLNCPPEGLEKIQPLNTPESKIFEETLVFMAKANDDTLNQFVANHPQYNYYTNFSKGTLDINIPVSPDAEIKTQTPQITNKMSYNLHTKSFEAVNSDIETHNGTKTIKSTNDNKIQEIEYERIAAGKARADFIKRQEIKNYDNFGNLIKTEKYEPGEIAGIANITEIDASGNVKILQKSTKDKNGNIKIKKDFSSPEGVRTLFNSVEDEMGNKRSNYKIIDKDGNVLLDRVQTFKILGENKFQSSLNGRYWDIEYSDDKIIIKDSQNGKTSEILLSEKFKGNQEAFKNIIKHMSAEQLLIMNTGKLDILEYPEIINGMYSSEKTNNAFWQTPDNKIYLGENTFTPTQQEFLQHNRSILAHEYGHFIDTTSKELYGTSISDNEAIQKIFKEEYQAFRKSATAEEEKFIGYFSGTEGGGPNEHVAESNLLINSNPSRLTETRAYYFQRNFPRTVAADAQEIEKIEQKAIEDSNLK